MLLKIEPGTPKGDAQLEAIGWAQDQINEILKLYFNGQWKIQRGLRIDFRLNPELQMNEKVKVDISHISPVTESQFNQAIEQIRENSVFEPEPEEVVSAVPHAEPKKPKEGKE